MPTLVGPVSSTYSSSFPTFCSIIHFSARSPSSSIRSQWSTGRVWSAELREKCSFQSVTSYLGKGVVLVHHASTSDHRTSLFQNTKPKYIIYLHLQVNLRESPVSTISSSGEGIVAHGLRGNCSLKTARLSFPVRQQSPCIKPPTTATLRTTYCKAINSSHQWQAKSSNPTFFAQQSL